MTPPVARSSSGGVFYLTHAKRKSDPIIDLALLKNRTFAASIWGGGLFYMGTTSQVFLMALLLQIGFGFSAFHAGLTLLVFNVAGVYQATERYFHCLNALGGLGLQRAARGDDRYPPKKPFHSAVPSRSASARALRINCRPP